jgi:hypothetical protein
MVVALLALFVAMGGVGYAAFKLPNNSVGSKQLKANAVNASKVKDGSLLAGDFKAGQLPAGQQGLKGDPCLPSDPACKGPRGDTGPQGPGAVSANGQFDRDNNFHDVATVDGVTLSIECDDPSSSSKVNFYVAPAASGDGLYGWGTSTDSGGIHAETFNGAGGPGNFSPVQLDIVVTATHVGRAARYVRFDISGLSGTKCNYHALAIPSG